jgi:hypothetical protein
MAGFGAEGGAGFGVGEMAGFCVEGGAGLPTDVDTFAGLLDDVLTIFAGVSSSSSS